MEKNAVFTEKAPAAIGPYAQAIAMGELVFTSGQLGLTPEGSMAGESIEEQTHQVIKNLGQVLAAAGSSLAKVVKTTVFLQDMNEFAAMNKIYGEYFSDNPPARSTVQVARLPKDGKVEIEVIAFKG